MGLHVSVEGQVVTGAPVLVLMHFLGGSGREWDEVVAELGAGFGVIRVDLPGFGQSSGETGYGVSAMADAVQAAIAQAGVRRFVLVGHSMSGKVAMVLARRLCGDARLAGLVLVAPSPPGPEPMGEEKRGMMLGLLGGPAAEDDLARATRYINKNETRDIPPVVEERAAREVLLMNRTAWVAWLTGGSKEDWSKEVGVLHLPALVMAGASDASLGPEVQTRVTMPHLGNARLIAVKGCSHLIPMERPVAMAAVLREFVASLAEAQVPEEYREFLQGERVAPNTLAVLAGRVGGPSYGLTRQETGGEAAVVPGQPAVVFVPEGLFTALQERTLRAMLARVIPETRIDLAGFVMARLATGKGDGWRYANLPEDLAAYREGLDRLAEDDFETKTAEEQDKALAKMAAKKGSVGARWFEEVRGDAVPAYVGHPATMARLGYSGVGVGGASTEFKGYAQVGVNERESWEPAPMRAEVAR